MKRQLAIPAALLVAAAFGCGDSGPAPPKTYPAKGKVVVEGGESPAGGAVQFVASDPTHNGSGEIGADGSFVLSCVSGNKKLDGLAEDTYKASVIPPQGSAQATKVIEVPGDFKVTAGGSNDFTLKVSAKALKGK
jgi:hypothetical protein